uniref:Anti-sigma factor n=1 Tax=Phenylobacterium glaciei TaxID=2803784 RepID=A0A974S7K7_9CAUL|nr:hypothetical protein JKL49_14625 [Phenylobacterium glaciei]
MKIDDRKLIAYVDGELDAFGRAEVEAAVAADPVLGCGWRNTGCCGPRSAEPMLAWPRRVFPPS